MNRSVGVAAAVFCCALVQPIVPTPASGADRAAVPWPEADALFQRDPAWRGGDGAGSIDLGGGRVLWLFGDSFVAPRDAPPGRRAAKLVNNSVGIQHGYDPVTAGFHTYHGRDDGEAAPFFRGNDETWLWPSGGAVVRDKLVILLMRIESTDVGLGFRVVGNEAVVIDNPGEPPDRWKLRPGRLPDFTTRVIYGSGGVASDPPYVFAVTPTADQRHSLLLSRWGVDSVLEGDLTNPEWWNGERWQPHDELTATPPTWMPLGASESSLHWDAAAERFVQVQASSFPFGIVMVRSAPSRLGPWSEQQAVFNPSDYAEGPKGLHYYAAKAHPEQECDGLAITYCSNAFDLGRVVRDETVYYPRFIRLPAEGPGDDRPLPIPD